MATPNRNQRTVETIVNEVIEAQSFKPEMSVVQRLIEEKRKREQEEKMLAAADTIIKTLERTETELAKLVQQLRELRTREKELLEEIRELDAKRDRINAGSFAEVPELAHLVN